MISRLFQRRSIQLAVVTVAFAVLVIALLPYGLSAGLVAWLRDQGARRVTIGDVSVNPFTARFSLRRLAVDEGAEAPIGVAAVDGELSQRALLDGRLLFDRLEMRDVRVSVARGRDGSVWRVGPLTIGATGKAAPGAAKPAAVGVRVLRIQNADVALSHGDQRLDIRLASGELDNLLPWRAGDAASLKVTGTLNGAPVALSGTARPFAPTITLAAEIKAREVPLDVLKALGAESGEWPRGAASLDGRLNGEFAANGRLRAAFEGAVAGRSLVVSRPDWPQPARAEGLDWSGQLTVATAKGGDGASFGAKGRLTASGLDLGMIPGYRLRIEETRLDGISVRGLDAVSLTALDAEGLRLESGPAGAGDLLSIGHLRGAGLSYAPASGVTVSSAAAEVRDGGPSVALSAANGSRIAFDGIDFAGLGASPAGGVSVKSLAARGLKTMPPATAAKDTANSPLSAAAVAVDDIAVAADGGIAVGSMTLDGARVAFINDASGFHGPEAVLTGGGGDGTAKATQPKTESDAPRPIRIDKVVLAKDSVVALRDETVKPAFATEWRVGEARFTDIDSARPEKPMRLRLSARNQSYGTVEAHGTARPFAARTALDIEARLERIDLPRLSPYLDREMGYVFKSGEGNVTARIKLGNGMLDARSKVTLRAMEVAPTRPEAAQAAAKQLSMPVEAALALLRDKNNDIQLEIPVSGDPRAPKFDLGNVIAKATTNAIQGASMGFLKIALQPFGAALLVGEIATKIAASIRLDSAVFGPGDARVEVRHHAYFARVAKTMAERPALRIKLCGRAVPADRLALAARRKLPPDKVTNADLTALAAARADAVKGYFVGNFGIDPSRIIACGPDIDDEPGAQPRVEFLI